RISGGLPEDEPVWTSPDWSSTYSVDFGDYDGDGDLDLAVGNLGDYDQVFANDEGSFGDAAVWTSADSGATRSIRWCDFAEDGYPDLAIAMFRAEPNGVYLNSAGTIQTSPSWISEDKANTTAMVCLDLDGNGSSDMIAANQDGYVVAYLSLLHSAPFVLSTSPQDGATDMSRTVEISVVLHDYDDDIDAGSVEFLVNGQTQSFSMTTTSVGTTLQYAPMEGYPPLQSVNIVIEASDLEGNAMPDYEFSFTTTDNSSPTLGSGYINPSSGHDQTLFYYLVNYSDSDWDQPYSAFAVIVSEIEEEVYRLDMECVTSSPVDGTYQASTSLPEGIYYYYFEFEDAWGAGARLPETGYYSGPEIVRHNEQPTLSAPQLSPPTGTSETTFWFSVNYKDADRDAASTASIVITSPGNTYTWDMALLSGSEQEGTYKYCASVPAGTYGHYFQFTDERGAIVRLPESGTFSGPLVTGESSPCRLSYGGVEPSLGTTNTDFTFRVHYFDADGDEPSVSTLYYKTDMTMSAKLTLGNGLLYDGDYTFTTKLSSAVEWYYFSVIDKTGNQARLPEDGYFYGPNLAGADTSSLLDSGGVDPIVGSEDDTFKLSVHYYDVAGTEPISAHAYLLMTGWSAAEPMQVQSGESPSNGLYVLDIALDVGSYQYYFVFQDSLGRQIRLPESGYFDGPSVGISNHKPTLTDVESSPGSGSAATQFTFIAHYFDEDGDEPGIASLVLHSGGESLALNLSLVLGSASNGSYSVTTGLPAGAYEYVVRFVDVRGGDALYPDSGRASGPTVGDFDLSLSVGASSMVVGDDLELFLDLKNNASSDLSVTLGVGVLLPTGEMLYFPDWGDSLSGLDLTAPAGFEEQDYPIVSLTVDESLPVGEYAAYAALFAPGDFGCPLSSVSSVTWQIDRGK
ncbi:VCBS repeat-containing protein, partial [bacterium]|nr:VCBS repeat-containing protein [bacterium]